MGPAVEPPATPLTSNNVDSMDAIGLGSDHEATEIDPASPAIEVNSGWAPMQHIYPDNQLGLLSSAESLNFKPSSSPSPSNETWTTSPVFIITIWTNSIGPVFGLYENCSPYRSISCI